jgi:hypothetical protein
LGDDRHDPAPAQRRLRQCRDREDLQRGADAEQQVSVLRQRARSFEGADRQELTEQHDNPRAGLSAAVPAGALVHALRHSFASLTIEYGTESPSYANCSATPRWRRPAATWTPPPAACATPSPRTPRNAPWTTTANPSPTERFAGRAPGARLRAPLVGRQ